MTTTIFYYFFTYAAVSCLMAIVLVPMMRPLSFMLGAVDRGSGRRVHMGIIPRLGGVGIFFAFAIPAVFSLTRGEWDFFHHRMAGVILASLIVLAVGIYDDLKGATVTNKLVAEIIAALIIYAWGIRITVISNPFGSAIQLGWMSLPVTVIWIIVVTNAINLIDGLDGLAAGTGIFISCMLLSLSGNDVHMQLVYAIMIGSLIGFLVYNFPPASIFMGDSGSLFLGFILGSTSIFANQKATAIATMLVPIIAFSFPLMDMFYAVLRRYYRGISIGKADREHIHHKLLDRGLSKRKVLFLLYAINITLMLFLLVFIRHQVNLGYFGLALLAAGAVLGLRMIGYIEFIPFIRNILKNYYRGRKRRYFNYVIRRFRQNVEKSATPEEFNIQLAALMGEYGFSFAEVRLAEGVDKILFVYGIRTEPEFPIKLSFPCIDEKGHCWGDILIIKERGGEHFLCATELISTLSDEVVRFARGVQRPV